MRYFLLFILLVIVVLTTGCVSESGKKFFKPTPTPTPPNYLNCNGTWYDGDYQTCCGNEVYINRSGLVCHDGKYDIDFSPIELVSTFDDSTFDVPTSDWEEEYERNGCTPDNGGDWINGRCWWKHAGGYSSID
jgi:hypothetical protein